MATRTITDVLTAAYAAGFSTEAQLLAVLGIGIAESSLDDDARNWHHEFGFRPSTDVIGVDGGDGEWNMPVRDQQYHSDRGLWQISSNFHPEYDDATCDDLDLAAAAVWTISSDGTDFSPWDTYPDDVETHYDDAIEGWPAIRPLVEAFLADLAGVAIDRVSLSVLYSTTIDDEDLPDEPTVTGIDPDEGPTEGGTVVTITGTNLTPTLAVTFGGVNAAQFEDDESGTTITATTPPHAAGPVQVAVTTPGGVSTVTFTFTFIVPEPPSDDGSGASPIVRLVTARALVIPHQVQRWVLPIICKEHVTSGATDDIEQSQDVAAVREFFLDLRRNGTPVVFQEGSKRHQVVVRDVSFPDGQVERWGVGRNGLQGLLFVTLDSTES